MYVCMYVYICMYVVCMYVCTPCMIAAGLGVGLKRERERNAHDDDVELTPDAE